MAAATRRLASLATLGLALLALAACGGGGAGSPTPAPSAAITPPGPTGESTLTPTPPAPDTPYKLVYRESAADHDTVWRVSPSDPSKPEQIASVAHSDGCAIKVALSPDARLLAYVVQPPGTPCDLGASRADAHVIDLKLNDDQKLAGGVDLRFTPLWSPDSQLLFLRRYAGQEFLASDVSIVYIHVIRKRLPGEPVPPPTPVPSPPMPVPEDPVKVLLQAKVSQVLAFIPVGFADDKRSLYFVQVQGGTGGGTLAASYAPATTQSIATATAEAGATATAVAPATVAPPLTPTPPSTFLVQLSDQIARDFDLSPDHKHLSYIAQQFVDGQFVDRTFVGDLSAKTVAQLPSDGLPAGAHLSPLWSPDGRRLAVGTAPSSGEPGAVALVPLAGGPPQFLQPPALGYDVPQAWAPDGTFLAVISNSGDLANPGQSRLDVVAPAGQRIAIKQGGEIQVAGWFQFG